RVVQLQLVKGVAQIRVVRAVNRIQPRVDHRLGFAVARQRFGGAVAYRRHGVADLRLADVLDPGDQVAHLPHAQACTGLRLGRNDADLEQFVSGAGGHHRDALTPTDLAVDHADVGHHAAVDVVHRVEDHRAGRRVGVALRGRYLTHHVVEQIGDALPGLAGHAQHFAG